MTLYTSTSLTEAMALPPRTLDAFFNGKAFDVWRQGKEAQGKNIAVISGQLNELIRGTGAVIRTIGARR